MADVLFIQEIINHILFELGVSKVSELEGFIQDDIERHVNRLGELEKLAGVYNDTVGRMADNVQGILEDDEEGLFEEEDEEDASTFAGLVFLNRFAWFCAHILVL